MQERIKGIATICGKDYSFGAEGGYGLILLDGHWTVVEFSCPFETLPPRGAGHVITQTFQLRVTAGQMFYEGQPVHVAIWFARQATLPVSAFLSPDKEV